MVGAAQLERNGHISELVRVLEDASGVAAAKTHAARMLWNFMESNDANRAAIVEVGAVPLLVGLLSGDTEEGRAAAEDVLGFLADGNDDIAAVIVEAGVVPLLVDLLVDLGGSEGGRAAAAELLGSLTNSDVEDIVADIVEAGAVPLLVDLLSGAQRRAQRQQPRSR
jgi:hypothetical protein